MGTKREEYVERLKRQIDEWNRLIDKWEKEGRSRSAEARQEAEERLSELREKRNEMRARLPEIQEAGERAFDELLDGINRAWKELSRAFERSKEEFESEEKSGPGASTESGGSAAP